MRSEAPVAASVAGASATVPAELRAPVLPPPGAHLHLVGVCGTGMTPLAMALAAHGWRVTGEDKLWPEEAAAWLERGGVERTPSGEFPAGAALVIHSSAVSPAHPTREAARLQGVGGLRRGEALAALVRNRPLIAIVGSHGKTTTTAMLITALQTAGITCDHLLGGLFADGRTSPAQWRGEGWVVAEIDESDGTIAGFAPEIMLCVNVDWDHCDRYADPAAIEQAFSALAARTRRAVFFNAGCAWSRRIFGASSGPAAVVSFGPAGDYALTATLAADVTGQTLLLGGRFAETSARVAASGAFNGTNATGALAVAVELGAGAVDDLLAEFPGVRRRQAVLPARAGVTVMEDYAHHPAEIAALLGALRQTAPRRLVAVFQPHRFTRTAQFKSEFARVLATADQVFLLDVYSAGESPITDGTSADVLGALRNEAKAPPAELLADRASAAARIAAQTGDGDLLLFVGAGDIDVVARETTALLRDSAPTPAGLTAAQGTLLADLAGLLSPETIVHANEPLGPLTTLRVGGAAAWYAEPANTADLQSILVAARRLGLPVLLLGRGSNLVVPDDGVRGLVVRLRHPHWRRFTHVGPGRYWAGAGLRLKELCGIACRAGETGFEFLEGIPGTIGGALRMNAGAMGGWMFDVVDEVHLLTLDGGLQIRRREELQVGYRSCADLTGAIALGAVLRARGTSESARIRARMREFQTHRLGTQPREPSAGCIFKNPPGDSAGRIIDELGLKGLRVGDAEVSAVHANFIINRGRASGADVIELVRRVRQEVHLRRNIQLEPEVLLYGREWREVLA